MTAVDGIHQIVLNLYGNLFGRSSHLLDNHLDALWFDEFELVVECLLPVVGNLLQDSDILLGQCQHDLSLEGNSITHVTTIPRSQTRLRLFDGLTHQLHHQFVSVGAPFVNLQTAVSASQVLDGHLHGSILGVSVSLLVVHCCGDVNTTGAADDEFSPMLRVEVQQDVTLQFVLGQFVGTKHTRLLVTRNQRVDGSMLQVLCLHDGHDGCYAQTVVGTQRGTLRLHPLTVNPRFNGVGLEVMLRLGCLLRHHIHVGLQDHALPVLIAWCGCLAEHDVSCGVLEGLYPSLLTEVKQELLYFL